MGVAGYINSTEEFGISRLLFFVIIRRFEEQRVGKGRPHVKMQSEMVREQSNWSDVSWKL